MQTNGSRQTFNVPSAPLLAEHDLPIVHAQRHHLTVIVEIKEFPARRFVLQTSQVGELVVAVEMHLERATAVSPSP